MKITTPGLYPDLPIETYHSNCCDGPSVSASVLHKMLAACPAIMWESSYLNPNRVPEAATSSFDLGRAAHALTLGEPEFARYFIVLPEDVPSRPSKRQRNAKKPSQDTMDAIDFWDAVNAAGKTLVKSEQFAEIVAMSQAQRRSPQVARAFIDGKPECSLVWLDAETGVWLKSRPDWLPHDPATRVLSQFKTCRSIEPRKLSMDAFSYGYHLAAALELDAVRAVLGVEPAGIAHVCQEKKNPYLAELRLFTPDQIEFGRREYRRALRMFADCWEKHLAGKPPRTAWPGFTDVPAYFETPYHIAKIMETLNGSAKPQDYDAGDFGGGADAD